MNRADVVAILKASNPDAREDDVAMYADLFVQYQEAAANVRRNGTIVAHPRTGAPIANPYADVQVRAMNQLRKIRALDNLDALWSAAAAELGA